MRNPESIDQFYKDSNTMQPNWIWRAQDKKHLVKIHALLLLSPSNKREITIKRGLKRD
jgi:hypothetical protein